MGSRANASYSSPARQAGRRREPPRRTRCRAWRSRAVIYERTCDQSSSSRLTGSGSRARRPAKQQRDGLLPRLSPLARGLAILLRGVSLGVLGCVRVPGRASVPARCRLRGRRYGLRLWGPSPDRRVPPQVDHRGLLPRCLLVRPGRAGQQGRLLFHERSLGRGPDESALCLGLSSGRIRRRGQGQWVA
jgi:hypothetical protein